MSKVLEKYKCGFPVNSVAKYEDRLKTSDIKYELVVLENANTTSTQSNSKATNEYAELLNKIVAIDINNLTPIQAYITLNEIYLEAKKLIK